MLPVESSALQIRPAGRVVMWPAWSHLLFLHWDFAPEAVQRLLPPGVQVDTYKGRAWVGLVPFTMRDVRPHWLPRMGRLGHFYDAFPELNVRTYVVRDGVPGVWFFSLDAGSVCAVLAARLWFSLPYFKARMRLRRMADGQFRYLSRRLWPPPLPARCEVRYRAEGEAAPARPGSLEHFLVERYVLYSRRGGSLFRGRVYHSPYPVQAARVEYLRENCLAAVGFQRPSDAPHSLYARGVEVEVFGLERC